MEDASPQFRWRLSNPVDGSDEILHQLLDIVGTSVSEVALGLRPYAFIGIEFRRVRGEVFDAQARVSPQQVFERFPMVGAGVVQQGNHWPLQVLQQVAEKRTDFLLPDVLEVELVEEAQPLPFRADGDTRDHRDLVPPIAMVDHRRLTTRRPGLGDVRDQQEAGFIRKDYMGAQPRGVFFTRGQSVCFQRAMASSSRSMARVSGF